MRGFLSSWIVGVLCLHGVVQAAVVVIDLRGSDGDYDFDAPTGVQTLFDDSLQRDFSVRINGVPGDAGDFLNATAEGFGVNESEFGDDPDELDFVNGQESVVIHFSLLNREELWAARLTQFDVAQFGVEEVGFYRLNGGAPVFFSSTGTVRVPSAPRLDGLTLEVGDAAALGNGFSLVSLGMNTLVLPEPHAASLILIGVGMLSGCCRIKSRFSIVRTEESC